MIVAALRKGNLRRAVELILDTYQDEVFGYCAGTVGMADSSKVYQQVLTNALEELPAFTGSVSIRAWLYGIARNTVVRHQQEYQPHTGHVEAHVEAWAPAAIDSEELPGLRLKDVELETCFASLEPLVREILQLGLWFNLPLSEVAYITGRTYTEVRRIAAEGLSTLSLEIQRLSSTPS